ncbi:TPA: hypothetical protein DD449_04135 [Candidatus Berkelbacteria bacterium]|uniref:Uncharacterized protein n=1 Tax=Berkelbacteria bacterium GW2011_GWE1_39_12 TaxID=1618337 RepID=A0A0G4B4D3_9BACT|nr:MAG: hypothetical protein UT28_C0001G0448 [Berkelbacteria bacterium GW2011_GWE1_39_12]HBO60844.1 hypothetical protein [Candidatus Berkelbacteria bacterium]
MRQFWNNITIPELLIFIVLLCTITVGLVDEGCLIRPGNNFNIASVCTDYSYSSICPTVLAGKGLAPNDSDVNVSEGKLVVTALEGRDAVCHIDGTRYNGVLVLVSKKTFYQWERKAKEYESMCQDYNSARDKEQQRLDRLRTSLK